METLDYAVMNNIGNNGDHKGEMLRRLASARHYGLESSEDYNILFVVASLKQMMVANPDRVTKVIRVGPERFSLGGRWKSMNPVGWEEATYTFFSKEVNRLDTSITPEEMLEAAKLAEQYSIRDTRRKKLAIVGFDNVNVRNPRELSYEMSQDGLISSSIDDRKRYRFANRGQTELKVGSRVLLSDAPTLTIEDFDEAPARMGGEALTLFLDSSKPYFRLNLIYDELKITNH